MVEQAGVRVASMLIHEGELVNNIVENGGLIENQCILSAKRLGHIKAIQPHLLRIDLLVPETPAFRARLLAELALDELDSPGIA